MDHQVLPHHQGPQDDRFDAWLALTGQVPAPDQPVDLPMLSGSMVPAIPVGAILQILVQTAAKHRVGDVVIFLEADKLTAHRILLAWSIGPWPWIFEKGDANDKGRWRRPTDICGRVVGLVTDGQSQANPTNAALASSSLRGAIWHWLRIWGGLRRQPNDQNENQI